MTLHSDGFIGYGYIWDDDTVPPWPNDHGTEDSVDEWAVRYCASYGLPAPNWQDRSPEGKAACHALCDEREKLLVASGCEVGHHCHSEYPMYYVTIASAHQRAARGYPQRNLAFGVGVDWDEKLADFCARAGIATGTMRPGWFLASYLDP